MIPHIQGTLARFFPLFAHFLKTSAELRIYLTRDITEKELLTGKDWGPRETEEDTIEDQIETGMHSYTGVACVEDKNRSTSYVNLCK